MEMNLVRRFGGTIGNMTSSLCKDFPSEKQVVESVLGSNLKKHLKKRFGV